MAEGLVVDGSLVVHRNITSERIACKMMKPEKPGLEGGIRWVF